jgi:hypothetical protein
LVTNEEVVCEVVDNGSTITIKNPIMAVPVPGEDGHMGLALASWMMMSKEKETEISKNHIICIVEPKDEIYNHYSQTCGVGLVIPEKGSIQI